MSLITGKNMKNETEDTQGAMQHAISCIPVKCNITLLFSLIH